VCLITGGASGIGAATARLFAREGATVVTIDLQAADGDLSLTADVADEADVDRIVAEVLGRLGRIDVLVNNAGIAPISPVADLDTEGWTAMIDVNLRGVLHGIAAALPAFRAQGRGHLVTTVSTAGLTISPAMAVYAATKNAVRTLLEGLRQESTDGTLRTTAVSPGYVQTDLADSMPDPTIRERTRVNMRALAIPPVAVARAVAFAIEQPPDVEIGEITIRPTTQA
jgi:NADP-dependent 3-hydroxy acid dehydrogenase YdfG